MYEPNVATFCVVFSGRVLFVLISGASNSVQPASTSSTKAIQRIFLSIANSLKFMPPFFH
jgi:hypothetical protein